MNCVNLLVKNAMIKKNILGLLLLIGVTSLNTVVINANQY